MARLRELLKPSEQLVIYHFAQDDPVAEFIVRGLLNEQRPAVDLGKGRSILFHKSHIPHREDHLHFLVKGAKIAAINQSGSAHDGSHGVQLQRWAIDGMQKYYPGFKLPPNGLIEELMTGSSSQLLAEAFDKNEVLLSKAHRILAEQAALD